MAKIWRRILCVFSVCLLTCFIFIAPVISASDEVKTPVSVGTVQQVNPYYNTQTTTYSDGTSLTRHIINGPSKPPAGYEPASVALPAPNKAMGTASITVPTYDWVFGCSSVSGAMIAGYYDRSGYPNMYIGPANGGYAPLNNSTTYWPTWSDGSVTYPNLPLAASHQGVDGRGAATKGSIDDYWIQYGSTANDPYITGSWAQHTWSDGQAIGDYMKTSQSVYGVNNTDGSTGFWNYNSESQLTCSTMETTSSDGHLISWNDGTYGRKLYYEARGYTVTTCYNQPTDNKYAGGFSFAQYKAEIDAGRPVMLNLNGHTIVGVGYTDTGNTVYLHDTWHQDGTTQSMTWGGSFGGMLLLSVSIVNLAAVSNPVPVLSTLSPTAATAGGVAFTLTVNGNNFVGSSVVRWGSTNLMTTFISSTQMTTAVTSADIATGATVTVTVFNPTPDGGTSGGSVFTINNPVPVISSLSPASATAGGSAFTLTVNGSNFVSTSKVQWDGTDRATTFISPTQLTAAIPASDIATAGTANVTIVNTTPGGGTSSASIFTISVPAPVPVPVPVSVSAPAPAGGGGGGGCFIATAAFGSPLERHVQILRDFRDRVLLSSTVGKAFVQFYYRTSQPIADKIAASAGLRLITRVMLMPVIGIAYLMVHLGMFTTLLLFTIALFLLVLLVQSCRLNRNVSQLRARSNKRFNLQD